MVVHYFPLSILLFKHVGSQHPTPAVVGVQNLDASDIGLTATREMKDDKGIQGSIYLLLLLSLVASLAGNAQKALTSPLQIS
jgi:hypothetical protein